MIVYQQIYDFFTYTGLERLVVDCEERLRAIAPPPFPLIYDVFTDEIYDFLTDVGEQVVDCEERLRATLAHELCHVAQWVVNHEAKPEHGNAFRFWAEKVEAYDQTLRVDTCHEYDINYRYRYKCERCGVEYGRHSNSIDVAEKTCGACDGPLEACQVPNPKP
ncbi:SprT-like family-domain-containing protein [Baffinella frigidus]|nr:SprT-like family-domain-containing protein [Cryptophyta sp. CCMP2293]